MVAVLALVLVPALLFALVFGMAWIEETLGRPTWPRPHQRGPVGH